MTREQADALMDALDAADVTANIRRRDDDYRVSILNFPRARDFITALNVAGIKEASYSAGSGWAFEFESDPS